jgi:hypothetical protein
MSALPGYFTLHVIMAVRPGTASDTLGSTTEIQTETLPKRSDDISQVLKWDT